MVGLDVRNDGLLKVTNLVHGQLVKESVHTGKDNNDLLLHGHGRVLRLLEKLGEARTTVQRELRRGIEIRTELRERRNLTGGRVKRVEQYEENVKVRAAFETITYRYWARKSLSEPATCFMARICAAEPTRDTDRPTLMAGRTPGE